MFELARRIPGVTCVDLYAEYPNLVIDVQREQQRLLAHDVVLFQFPLYWYSTPAILKEWQDLVLEHGFAYGANGHALRGKGFLCVLSAGGSSDAYSADGLNRYSIGELLRPLEQMACLTGMQYLPPLVLFGSRDALEEGRLSRHLDDWRRLLTALVADALDLQQLSTLALLNDCIADLPEPTPGGQAS